MSKIQNMTAEGGYVIDVIPTTNEVGMNVVGKFTPQQADQFHKDYEKQVNSIKPSDFQLNVDCTTMKVISQDMVPALQHSFELYKQSGFKKIKFITNGKSIIKMQLNRIAKSAGLPNFEVM